MRSRSSFTDRFELEISLILFVLIIGLCRIVNADPAPLENVHLNSAATCTTVKGSVVVLPAGWFLNEAKHAALDAETKRLQDVETKIIAENGVLRASVAGWQPGWKTLLVATLAGMAAVIAIERAL